MALRKLQAEIDRTLKTVTQGVELFESTFDKLNHANNATQKDKFEQDLKTQIKKLQRLRDQIKVWLGSSDIKDKSALLDNRKLIETQMERFKALEKEMKMKAFSKEGLIAAAKLDPAEKAKRDTIDWIGTTTDELSRQIEQTEAEAESLQANGKKKKQAGDRLGELETLNERRTWHIGRLEVVQRMLENGQLTVEQVESVQEDVKYFVEANTEEDFDFDGGMYDDLNLQDEDVDYMQDYAQADELSNMDTSSVTDGGDAPKTPAKEEKRSVSSSKADESPSHPPSPVAARKVPLKKATLEPIKAEAVKTPTKPEPVPPVPTPSSAPKAAPLPPIRYAAAAAAAVTPQSITSPPIATVPAPAPAPVPAASAPAQPAEVVVPRVATPVEEKIESPAVSVLETPQTNGHAPPPPPGLSAPTHQTPLPSPSQPTAPTPASIPTTIPQPTTQTPQTQPQSNGVTQSQPPPPPGYGTHAESSRSASASYNPATASSGAPSGRSGSPRKETGVLGTLIQSFDIAKELSERRANDVNELHSALDVSYQNAPQQIDAEPPRYYHPRNPVATPSYYPQHKLPILEDKTIYSRLELDQLFYIFYYMTGTYEQWLAARELKRQSWRFHKQYLTWFQRAHNPQAITEDYEQGGYFYFDWENSWCQRKKSDFRFEYRWLSDH